MIKVRHYKDLKALQNHEEGETAYVESDKCGYIYHDGKWTKVKSDGSGLKMNLYEFNKSIISQYEPMDEEALIKLKNKINEELDSTYYLLYGKEISYFTLFEKRKVVTDMLKNESLGDMVLECLKSFEKVYCYEYNKESTKAFEIWVKDESDDLATVLYLFDYKDGVVYYE